SENGIFTRNPFGNIYLLGAVLSSLFLLLVVLYVEKLQPIFYTTALGLHDWLLIIVLSAIPTVLFGFSKKIRSRKCLQCLREQMEAFLRQLAVIILFSCFRKNLSFSIENLYSRMSNSVIHWSD